MGPVTELVMEFRRHLQLREEELENQKKLFESLKDTREYQRDILDALTPFKNGIFHEDRQYDEPLPEFQKNVLIAETDKRPQAGFLFYINITFYGPGGQHCSGRMQLDGASLEFEQILTMHRKGITEPIVAGWYVSAWDTGRNIYGVSWTTNTPVEFEEQFRLFISNENIQTQTQVNNVTYDLQVQRYNKDKVARRSIRTERERK